MSRHESKSTAQQYGGECIFLLKEAMCITRKLYCMFAVLLDPSMMSGQNHKGRLVFFKWYSMTHFLFPDNLNAVIGTFYIGAK